MIRVAATHDPFGFASALEAAGAKLVAASRTGRVITLDATAFDASAGATRIAYFPRFEVDWNADGADAIFVAHDMVKDALDAAIRRDARVLGALPPHGLAVRSGDAPTPKVVVVDGRLADEVGCTALALQWQLAKPARYLFDVGDDVERAGRIRSAMSGQGVQVGLFGAAARAEAWAMASLAMGARLANHALAVGVGVVCVEGDSLAARALAASGVAAIASNPSTLSLTLDAALGASDDLRQAAIDQNAGATAARVLEAAARVDEPTSALGGVEWLDAEVAHNAGDDLGSGGDEPSASDDAIERELAELKAKLGN